METSAANTTQKVSKIGLVVSDKMQKTVVVAVEFLRRHPLYKKPVKHTRRFKAHAEPGVCKVGDRVRIVETRPLSKEKNWRVDAVVVPGEQIKIEV